jgi:hypothetical protein
MFDVYFGEERALLHQFPANIGEEMASYVL